MAKKVLVLFTFLVVLAALMAAPAPARAGSWATVGVTELPAEIHAGQQFTLEFMVWQHGNKPVHQLSYDPLHPVLVEPRVTFTNADGGGSVTALARPLQQPGLFGVDIILPTEGQWEWQVEPEPLAGVTEFDALEILPPPSTKAVQATLPAAPAAMWPAFLLGSALVVLGLLAAFVSARRMPAARGTVSNQE